MEFYLFLETMNRQKTYDSIRLEYLAEKYFVKTEKKNAVRCSESTSVNIWFLETNLNFYLKIRISEKFYMLLFDNLLIWKGFSECK